LLKRLPNCTVWGCDISEAAIAITLGNARRHGVHERLTLAHGDWKKILPNNFDVVVSNPPYIPSSLAPSSMASVTDLKGSKHKDESRNRTKQVLQPEIHFEPKEALFAGEDGLDFYKQFAQILPKHFSPTANQPDNILAAFEIGDNQEQDVLSIFKNNGWRNLQIKYDINGMPRVLTALPSIQASPPRG
jgi:release factor glutamine methyltransferase